MLKSIKVAPLLADIFKVIVNRKCRNSVTEVICNLGLCQIT
jgi:hypothetical protein